LYNRRRRKWLNYSPRRGRSAGQQAARRHIQEANQLTQVLGGTDNLVKNFLFDLPPKDLDEVLAKYGDAFGRSAEEYARITMPLWRIRKVHMSGMVAERLYKFLPPRMPVALRYEIAEGLWRHVGPSSHKTLRFGPDVPASEIIAKSEAHITEVVVTYKIPEQLERQFNWLTSDDVSAKQQLLNHLRDLDKGMVVEAVRLQATVMTQHLQDERAKNTQLFTHTVTVGKHQLQLEANFKQIGSELVEYQRYSSRARTKDQNWIEQYAWIGIVAVVIGIIVIANIAN
jgi:hypothetical protein